MCVGGTEILIHFGIGFTLCTENEPSIVQLSTYMNQVRDELAEERSKLSLRRKHHAELMITGRPKRDVSKLVEISGYLFQERKKLGKGWRRQYIMVRDGMIWGHAKPTKGATEPVLIALANLLLCTVKVHTPIANHRQRSAFFNLVTTQC
jgi:hypothetical protein